MKSPTGSWISLGRILSWKLVVMAAMFLILLMEWKRFSLVIEQPSMIIARQQETEEWNFQAGQRQLLKKLGGRSVGSGRIQAATTTTAPDLKIPSQEEKTFGDSGRFLALLSSAWMEMYFIHL